MTLALLAAPVVAKPIAYANGTTVMAEYGAGTMNEALEPARRAGQCIRLGRAG